MLANLFKEISKLTEAEIDKILPIVGGSESRLHEAMRYSSMSGGKRVRPLLVVACGDLFDVDRDKLIRVAAAVELIHTYSLIHDDLPAMDNDEMRRGKPTCHIKFDEATAILAGDALLTLGFEVLADPKIHPSADIRIRLITELSSAVGPRGMVGGQMLDLLSNKIKFTKSEVLRLQSLKTGALIEFSCKAGAILSGVGSRETEKLTSFARDLGLIYQFTDDLLDVDSTVKETGKMVNKDADLGKATIVSLIGKDEARKEVSLLAERALKNLEIFQEKGEVLRALLKLLELGKFYFFGIYCICIGLVSIFI